MDYPKIPHDEKKCVKLSLERIELLRESYRKHKNYRLVGRIFGVKGDTVKYWTDENFKHNAIKRSAKCLKIKMQNKTYRARMNAIKLKNMRERFANYPQLSMWYDLSRRVNS